MISLRQLQQDLEAMTPGPYLVWAEGAYTKIVTENPVCDEDDVIAEVSNWSPHSPANAHGLCSAYNAIDTLIEIAKKARLYVRSLPYDTTFNQDGFAFLEALAKVEL